MIIYLKKIFLAVPVVSQETLTTGTITGAHDWAASAELEERVTIIKKNWKLNKFS